MLYLYDDAVAREFEPFALTRPVSELRAGVELLRRRWSMASGLEAAAFIGAPHLADFEEAGAPPSLAGDATIPAGAILANSRCVIPLDVKLRDDESVWRCDGRICAVRLTRPIAAPALADGSFDLDSIAPANGGTTIDGRWVSAVWDLIGQLSVQLTEDILAIANTKPIGSTSGEILGTHTVLVEKGATIEPYVVLDASAGPILVSAGASISAFTRLVGPCFIGPDSVIVGDRVANCSIGEKCKIRGEISSSIVLGHSNKGHTGFVGHSYLGRWVNLGAGTTTSNLKNTYGTVQLLTRHGLIETGQQFLGTMFGDHVKTGIGTMLTTGTILGAGANIYGSGGHPKRVPPFAWGDGEPYASFQVDKFIAVATRMMQRRGVTLTPSLQRQLALAHARGTSA